MPMKDASYIPLILTYSGISWGQMLCEISTQIRLSGIWLHLLLAWFPTFMPQMLFIPTALHVAYKGDIPHPYISPAMQHFCLCGIKREWQQCKGAVNVYAPYVLQNAVQNTYLIKIDILIFTIRRLFAKSAHMFVLYFSSSDPYFKKCGSVERN